MMAFPLPTFRILYPAFAADANEVVLAFAGQAQCLADTNSCECSEQAWMALTAHLLALRPGQTPGSGAAGPIASATIDKVSVSFVAPPAGDSWSYWLGSTPYGQQAMALLKACSAGGFYVGGLPERRAFTKVYGVR